MVDFYDRVERRELVVGVVGLGYVGLPLALAHAEVGFTVVGFDVDVERCVALNEGRSPIEDIAGARLTKVVSAGRFRAVADAASLEGVDVVFICVPTPADRHQTPDLSYVHAALTSVAEVLRSGVLVILQSTTYPGTTTEVCRPRSRQPGCAPVSTSISRSHLSASTLATPNGPWPQRPRSSGESPRSAGVGPRQCSAR